MCRARRLLVVSALASFGLLVVSVGAANAGTTFVSPGQSIQAAVDAASPGDTIFVLPGIYQEDVVVQTDGIALRGLGAVLEPGQESICGSNGFCVLGDVVFGEEDVTVNDYVQDVRISGFVLRGFDETGIIALGAQDARFDKNRAFDNQEYGIAAFASTGTRVAGNVTTGSTEAGIYIGDSPNADAFVADNATMGNGFGIFLRNSMHGTILNNVSQGNCLGVLVLADEPGPAGFYRLLGNKIRGNSLACPESEDGPPVSGVGVAIFGAMDNALHGNVITDNVPTGPTLLSAGVAVVSGFGGTAPNGNVVTGNTITGNDPDLLWDGTGDNTLAPNHCTTSVPPGFC
jgi:Right handed beta helix region